MGGGDASGAGDGGGSSSGPLERPRFNLSKFTIPLPQKSLVEIQVFHSIL